MSGKLKAPRVKHYICILKDRDYRAYNNNTSYDDRTYELLDEIFALINACHLYRKTERGSCGSRQNAALSRTSATSMRCSKTAK